MRVLGMISGTSHDAIDTAVVALRVQDGVLEAEVCRTAAVGYEPGLRARLARALPPGRVGMAEVCRLDTEIGRAFADAAAEAVAAAGPVELVCSHGQTFYHWVEDGTVRGTLQLGQPAWIAERLGVPVVADLRARDIAAGGQGAPLVSYPDALLLAGLPGRPGALNLGGIANLTTGGRTPLAYDTGPANALLDAVTSAATGRPYDEDGRLAATGTVHQGLLADLLAEPYYRLPPPKSTGKELFHGGYPAPFLARWPGLATPDVLRTLVALTARTAADAVRRHGLDTLLVSGGGVRNPPLMAELARELPGVRVAPSDEVGLPADAKEAVAFAVLGWHTAHGLPSTLPSCTGASGPRVLGTVVPGAPGASLPPPLPQPPHGLRILR
ncbi:anhydro-N-acetylmuramic acid kinase [Streptomyces sp. NPDC051976]|uniref:anhydro-N-acetylmuramic acid kinase n=1 Tax=Streptomyces sp. NPDC051976 TaxID=3154947 RepID=UPI00341B10FD